MRPDYCTDGKKFLAFQSPGQVMSNHPVILYTFQEIKKFKKNSRRKQSTRGSFWPFDHSLLILLVDLTCATKRRSAHEYANQRQQSSDRNRTGA